MADPTPQMIQDYITLDNKISELERTGIGKKYQQYKSELDRLKAEETQQKAELQQLSQRLAKEQRDVEELSSLMEKMLMKGEKTDSYNGEMEKEEAEHREAMVKHDASKQKLKKTEADIALVKEKMAPAQTEFDELQKLYDQEDEILNSIFGGSYGSAEENRLEADHEMLQEKKKRIDVAMYKWTNGRNLLKYAVTQLAQAIKDWGQMKETPMSDKQKRYYEATQARNNLLAAIQNIENTQNYLSNINFPYCAPPEVQTLSKAMENIYTDMMSPDRIKHAELCYVTTQKRCAALLQWFDAVINTTITKDLQKASESLAETKKHLKAERMRLLKIIADKFDIKFDIDEATAMEDKKPKADVQDNQQSDVKPAGEMQQQTTPAPQMKNVCDQLPSEEEIFGNMEELIKKHDQRINDYQKIEDINKARVDQGLQEKLAERKRRRMQQTS